MMDEMLNKILAELQALKEVRTLSGQRSMISANRRKSRTS
jgi:hypothetical protein